MPFKSSQRDIGRKHPPFPINTSDIPSANQPRKLDLALRLPSFIFNSHSPFQLAGYTNALTKERLFYSEVKTHTTHLSTALVKHYDLKKGDVVALFSPNTICYPVAMLAVNRIGGIISGASPAYNVEEMTYALKTAGAKFLFTVPGSMGVAAEAAKNAGIGKERVFLLEGEMQGFRTMGELL